ncbi:universal stress protein [Nocardioides sp. KR10-350]|uniref:universal stress protein n=1 Tax=Nocardioides cheoyonin TaxID=3156615 RepID=UPI0032B5B19F
MTSREQILVGVDGGPGGAAAVRYAIEEAERHHRDLRLVHVAPWYSPAPMFSLVPTELEAIGRRILSDAAAEPRRRLGTERVTTSLMTGSRVGCSVQAATHAVLVVLGNDRPSLVDRVLTGAMLSGLAARSTHPVVAVPNSWTRDRPRNRVVVGVKNPDQATEQLRRALAIAGDRGAELQVVHAWELPGAYDDIIADRTTQAAMNQQVRDRLRAVVDQLVPGQPVPSVDIRIEHGQPARVLQRATARADLLLLERRPHAFPLGHLGATGRALLREGLCPVEVLPPSRDPWKEESLVLESAGVFHAEEEQPL